MKKLLVILIFVIMVGSVSALSLQQYLNLDFKTIDINWKNNGWGLKGDYVFQNKSLTNYYFNETSVSFYPVNESYYYYASIESVKRCVNNKTVSICKKEFKYNRDERFNFIENKIRLNHIQQQHKFLSNLTDEEVLNMMSSI